MFMKLREMTSVSMRFSNSTRSSSPLSSLSCLLNIPTSCSTLNSSFFLFFIASFAISDLAVSCVLSRITARIKPARTTWMLLFFQDDLCFLFFTVR